MTSNTIYHYVYRITNTVEKKHYYGKRSSKCDPKQDLGIKYFSSSFDKEFKIDQKKNPQNYKYKIVAIFPSEKKASSREIRLHTKFDVKTNEKFYNRCNATTEGFSVYGTKASPETREKLSISWRSRRQRELVQRKHRAKSSQETKDKIRKSNTGKILSEETKLLMSLAKKGKPKFFSEKHKENHRKAVSGSNCHTARKITIYNAIGNTMYTCFGNFHKICEENNLPFSALRSSLHNSGKPIFTLKNAAGLPVKRALRWEKFVGWYANYSDDSVGNIFS